MVIFIKVFPTTMWRVNQRKQKQELGQDKLDQGGIREGRREMQEVKWTGCEALGSALDVCAPTS